MIYRIAILLSLFVVCACKDDEVHSVEYYLENNIKRAERLAVCETLHNAEDDANCINAREAQTQIATKDRKNDWLDQIEAETSKTVQ